MEGERGVKIFAFTAPLLPPFLPAAVGRQVMERSLLLLLLLLLLEEEEEEEEEQETTFQKKAEGGGGVIPRSEIIV